MNVIAWIIFGGLSGWVASLVMLNNGDYGVLGNIVIGILGAVLGGFLAQSLGASGISGFNFYSLFVAILGSMLLLSILKVLHHHRP